MADAHHRAAVAERAARAGGVVARESFRADVAVETKDNRNDLVTTADFDAQSQVVATIRQEFPDDAFLLEETPATVSASTATSDAEGGPPSGTGGGPLSGTGGGPTVVESVPDGGAAWIVDPVDGTANFVRGIRTWCTSIAGVVDGDAVCAATYLPALDDVYAAGPESVTRNDETMAVSERSDPETFAVAAAGWWDRTARSTFADLCGAIVERFGDLRRMGSFQATLAHVASGGLEGVIAPGPSHPWDTVAGVHLVRRAGGTVTDLEGDRWTPDADGLVATNERAHGAVLEAAREATE